MTKDLSPRKTFNFPLKKNEFFKQTADFTRLAS